MIKVFDRIKEISTTDGTGNFKLEGALFGFRPFSSVYASGDYCYYTIVLDNNYEIGSGEYIFDGSNHWLSRFPIHSTNSNNLVNFSNGVKEVFVTYPAKYAVYSEKTMNSGNLAFWGAPNSLDSTNSLSWNGSSLQLNGVNVSVSGHTHTSNDILDFNQTVSGLLPVKNILAGSGVFVSSASGVYTINSTVDSVKEAASIATNVFNKTANTITKGSVVYINGGQGDQPTIQLAIAINESGSSKTYGVVQSNIPSMSPGKVVVFGALTGLNTDQYNPTSPVGDVNGVTLWLSPSVSGAMTTTKPFAPNHTVSIGTIVRTHQNEGVVEVKIQNGVELEELHDVAITNVINGQFLQYNGASGLWVPTSSGNFSTLLVGGTPVSISGHVHTVTDITNFASGVSGLLPITNIVGGPNISVTTSGTTYTIGVSGQLGLTAEQVDDRVASLLVAGTGIVLNYNDNSDILTINTSGLQPSGNYSVVGHTHSSSDIIDFNSAVSNLLPRVANSGDNRVLTSTGSTSGINAEPNLTFDGNIFNVFASGYFADRVGIGTANPQYLLDVSGTVRANHITAITKSFLIPHPLDPAKQLRYASLEGPENGVYVRGCTSGNCVFLPDYWHKLIDEKSITVNVTPLEKFQPLFVKSKNSNCVEIGGVEGFYDYTIWAERVDVEKLKVE